MGEWGAKEWGGNPPCDPTYLCPNNWGAFSPSLPQFLTHACTAPPSKPYQGIHSTKGWLPMQYITSPSHHFIQAKFSIGHFNSSMKTHFLFPMQTSPKAMFERHNRKSDIVSGNAKFNQNISPHSLPETMRTSLHNRISEILLQNILPKMQKIIVIRSKPGYLKDLSAICGHERIWEKL